MPASEKIALLVDNGKLSRLYNAEFAFVLSFSFIAAVVHKFLDNLLISI